MKVGSVMKRTIILMSVGLLLTCNFMLISCSDEKINQPETDNTLHDISGRITNWNYGSGKSLSMYPNPPYAKSLVGNSVISSNGDFSILLSDPPSTELKSILELEEIRGNNNLSISDTSVKGCFSEFLIKLDSENHFIGEMSPEQNQNTVQVGNYSCRYIYLDKSISITGKLIRTIYNDSYEVRYNLNYSKGWNIRTDKFIGENMIDSVKRVQYFEYKNTQEPDMVFKAHMWGGVR